MKGAIIIRYFNLIILFVIGVFFTSNTAYASTNYTVQTGDTLTKISNFYEIEIDELINANPFITSVDFIKLGQIIEIPNVNERSFTVTAYTAGYESTRKHPGDPGYGITASGTTVKEGQTIACPSNIPFGTKIYIHSLKETYICEDRGSAITQGKLDIYIEDLSQALQFGVKNLQAQIIN